MLQTQIEELQATWGFLLCWQQNISWSTYR